MLLISNGILALCLRVDTNATLPKVPEFHKLETLPLLVVPNLTKPELPKVELSPPLRLPTLRKPEMPLSSKPEFPVVPHVINPELPPLSHLPDLSKPTVATIPSLPKDIPLIPSLPLPHSTSTPFF